MLRLAIALLAALLLSLPAAAAPGGFSKAVTAKSEVEKTNYRKRYRKPYRYKRNGRYKYRSRKSAYYYTPSYKRKKKTYGKRRKMPEVVSGGGRPYIKPVRPRVVKFRKRYKPGSIVIDHSKRKLYYVLKGRRAYQYPIAVGKKGFGWTGTKKISMKKKWPDWRPPKEMRKRKPHLPKLWKGGVTNPLGSKALYLGSSLYRIHGTNNSKSIGTASSSGCFRMKNGHIAHLYKIAKVGTTVYVRGKL